MKSFTQLKADYGVDTKNTATTNISQGVVWMNDFYRKILSAHDWPFLHRLRTVNTVASTTFVNLPYDVDQVESVFVTVSSTRYTPKPAPSREFWDQLQEVSNTSDFPEYWFIFNGQIGLWPTPTSTDNVISLNCKISHRDLNTEDVTSSTITTLANGTAALTVNAGLTAQMAGFWIRPTFSTTANTGDGRWYEISSVTNATTATLVRPYGGTSITAGTAACTISQTSLLPETYQHLAELYAAYRYWNKEKGEASRASQFLSDLNREMDEMMTSYNINDLSMVVRQSIFDDEEIINPNLLISF